MGKGDNSFRYNRETFDMLTTFVDNMEVGLYVADYYTGEVLFVNRKMASYSGESNTDNMIGRRCWTNLNPNESGRCSFCPYKKLIDKDGNPTGPFRWELYLEPFRMWIKVINQAIIWTDGRLAHMVTFYDITENKDMQERLSNLAFKDRLLGLKNDLSLERDIRGEAQKPSLIFFDILSLQKINETYGREMGDYLLCSIRDWILALDIPDSRLYRIGGDEFCLTVENVMPETLKELGDILSRRFSEPWLFGDDESRIRVFCSADIAVVLGEYIRDSEPLMNLIDRTLKTAKNRKTVTVYDEKMDRDYKERLRFEQSLRRCVRENMEGFEMHYQPIVDPYGGAWSGLEALCRWHSPELGAVPPILFIPEAERLELIGPIGIWALETAIRKCREWDLCEHEDFILDVNVSALQFLDETLSGKIIKMLENYDYPGQKLCLEITESARFIFTDQSLNTIERLREYGVLVALDDFGTGYSSFNNLKNLPVDIVKIEREFVTTIESDEYQQFLFRVMAQLVHTVGMKLVAEGVEREGQMDILVKNGADRLQGYLFSEPLPPGEMGKLLNNFQCPSIDGSYYSMTSEI